MQTTDFDLEAALREIPDVTPCDSPIEDIFYYEYQKVAAPGVRISRQFECSTKLGTFYLDFLVELANRRIGIECDGKDFHDRQRDDGRDRAIIEAGRIDCIYRLRGRDIYYHLHDAFDLMRFREGSFFSQRGLANIKALASREHEHRDQTCNTPTGYSYAVVRWHERAEGQSDWDEDRTEGEFPFPTVVRWMDKYVL